MAITYRGTSTLYESFGAGSPYTNTATMPAGVTAGDIIVMQVAVAAGEQEITITSSGAWTLISSASDLEYSTHWYYLKYTGEESTAVGISADSLIIFDLTMLAFKTDNPKKVCDFQAQSSTANADSEAWVWDSISGTAGGALIVAASNSTFMTVTPPTGMTERVENNRNTVSAYFATKPLTETGATGAQTPAGYGTVPGLTVDHISISLYETDAATVTQPQIPPYTLAQVCGYSESYQQRESWATLAAGNVYVDQSGTAFKRDFRLDYCDITTTQRNIVGSAFSKVIADNGTATYISPGSATYTVTVHPDAPDLLWNATDSLGTMYWSTTMRLREV